GSTVRRERPAPGPGRRIGPDRTRDARSERARARAHALHDHAPEWRRHLAPQTPFRCANAGGPDPTGSSKSPWSTIVTVPSGCRSNQVAKARHLESGESGGTWFAEVWIRMRPGPVGPVSRHRSVLVSNASPPIQNCGSAPGARPSPGYPGDETVTGITVGCGSDPMSYTRGPARGNWGV